MFRHNMPVQRYIDVIYNEGRFEDLIKVCDIYHNEFDTVQQALEWGLNVGEYMGRYKYGDEMWRFITPDLSIHFYFLGSLEEITKRVNSIL